MDRIRAVDHDDDIVFAHPFNETANVKSLLLELAELRDRDWSALIIGDDPRPWGL